MKSSLPLLFSTLLGIILGGTVFYRVVEGWTWIDAYFFTVVTLSTVGYGNLVPATAMGKIGTTVLIFAGLGVFAIAIQQLGNLAILQRKKRLAERRKQLGTTQSEDD